MADGGTLADGSGPVPSTAEALARLDESMVEAMMTQRAIRRVRPDPVDDAVVLTVGTLVPQESQAVCLL